MLGPYSRTCLYVRTRELRWVSNYLPRHLSKERFSTAKQTCRAHNRCQRSPAHLTYCSFWEMAATLKPCMWTQLASRGTASLRCPRHVWTVTQRRFASGTAQSKALRIAGRDVSVPTGIFINNGFHNSVSGNTFGIENPSTGKEIIQIQEGREEDVSEAVCVARNTFNSRQWSEMNLCTAANFSYGSRT